MIRKFTSDSCTKTSKQSLTKQNYLIFKAFDGRDGGLNCLRHDAITFATMEKLRIKNLTLTFIFYIIGILSFQAQDYKRTSVWYFGQNAGLDFNTSPPTPLTDGQINTIEGCATICDTNGNLLLYTDGRTVWNRNHQVMENGTGLFGNASSTQAALILPLPGNDSLYYLFVANGWNNSQSGLYYNVIDIKKNNSLGKVLKKNIRLNVPISEKLAATNHRNGDDFWITTTDFIGNNIYSYLLTKNGIVECPVISPVDINFSALTAAGAMKFSPSGALLSLARHNMKSVDVMYFNNQDGIAKHWFTMEHSHPTYGLEFSMSEEYLYVSERYLSNLWQYNLNISSSLNIEKHKIYSSTFQYDIQGLQLASNNKIYMAFNNREYLGVINNPDSVYNLLNFDSSGQNLNGKKSAYGLPAFASSYLNRQRIDFQYSLIKLIF